MPHKTTVSTERYYARVRPKDALERIKRVFTRSPIDSEWHGRERRRAESPYTCEIRVNGRVVCQNSRPTPTDVLSQHEGRKTGSHLPL